MKFIVETISRDVDGYSYNPQTKERIVDIKIRETKLFGLRLYSVIKGTFVTEYRILSIPIKRYRLKEWRILLHQSSS